MSITFAKSFVVNGKAFATLDEAQEAALVELFTDEHGEQWGLKELVGHIVDHSDAIIDILTTTPSSRPKARKVNGGTKARKAKAENSTPDLLMRNTPNP